MARGDVENRGANIFDVARLAGVSHQTVSRVLNDSPSVRPATRERVQVAIKQLRYQPSQAARSLVTRRSRTIGVVGLATADYGPSSIQLHVNAAAAAARYAVLTVAVPEPTLAAARSAVESLLRQNVEAVVLVLLDVAMLDGLRALDLGIPVVPIASGPGRGPLAVSIDQYGGARAATANLLGAGYGGVAHVAGPATHPDAIERMRGWSDELAAAGVARGPLHVGDWSSASGFHIGLELDVRSGDAVFAANDQMALGLLAALKRRGLDVPYDVGVAGFDDVPEAAYFSPPLTSVRQDFEALGRLAMRRVLDALDGTEPGEPVAAIPPDLIARTSTARPRRAGGSAISS